MARTHCIHNLHMIAVALQSYYVRYQSYPPAYVADEDGKPAHSWRVLVLPFLGPELKQLYDRYRFDEPWNGPNNSKLAETDISTLLLSLRSNSGHSNRLRRGGRAADGLAGERIHNTLSH